MMNKFLFKGLVFVIIVLFSDQIGFLVLSRGLDDYFNLNQKNTILCVGHSHTLLGIDDQLLGEQLGVQVAKFAVHGANVGDRFAMLKHYFEVERPLTRIVVYDVDDHLFSGGGLSSNSYKLFFPFINSINMHNYVSSYASKSEFIVRKHLKLLRFNGATLNLSIRGLMDYRKNLKFGTVDIQELKRKIELGKISPATATNENLKILIETIEFLRKKDVRVFLTYIPTVDLYNRVDEDKHDFVVDLFKSLAAEDGVEFLDFNSAYESHYKYFYDSTHLNKTGQERITRDLSAVLKDFL